MKLSEEGPAITSQLDLHLDAQVRLVCSFTCEQFSARASAHPEPRKTVRENHRTNLANLMARFCFQFLNPKTQTLKKKGLGFYFFFGQAQLYKTFLKSIYKFYILFIFFGFVLNNLKNY